MSKAIGYNRIEFVQDTKEHYDARFYKGDTLTYRTSMRTGDALNLMDKTRCPYTFTSLEGRTIKVG